jgi:hypothetical protein
MKGKQEVLEYISRGRIGCTFAAVAARNPDKYDWGFYEIGFYNDPMPELTHSTATIIFPACYKKEDVRAWALRNGMYEEVIRKGSWLRRFIRWVKGEKLVGLRYTSKEGYAAYAMYMGPDSHCPTRLTPYPTLTFRTCSTTRMFYKVGFSGVLHIAQMPVLVALEKAQVMWNSSHKNAKKIVGKELNEEHAAKTTFKITNEWEQKR